MLFWSVGKLNRLQEEKPPGSQLKLKSELEELDKVAGLMEKRITGLGKKMVEQTRKLN